MASVNVRISEEAHQVLRKLSDTEGASMQSLLDQAIEQFRRNRFLAQANEAFAALRANSRAWREELEERTAWDRTLSDGIKEK